MNISRRGFLGSVLLIPITPVGSLLGQCGEIEATYSVAFEGSKPLIITTYTNGKMTAERDGVKWRQWAEGDWIRFVGPNDSNARVRRPEPFTLQIDWLVFYEPRPGASFAAPWS